MLYRISFATVVSEKGLIMMMPSSKKYWNCLQTSESSFESHLIFIFVTNFRRLLSVFFFCRNHCDLGLLQNKLNVSGKKVSELSSSEIFWNSIKIICCLRTYVKYYCLDTNFDME